jgi:hypothetical protein
MRGSRSRRARQRAFVAPSGCVGGAWKLGAARALGRPGRAWVAQWLPRPTPACVCCALQARYIAYRQAGYLTPFSVRKTPYKQKIFSMGTHIIKEYTGARSTVREGAARGRTCNSGPLHAPQQQQPNRELAGPRPVSSGASGWRPARDGAGAGRLPAAAVCGQCGQRVVARRSAAAAVGMRQLAAPAVASQGVAGPRGGAGAWEHAALPRCSPGGGISPPRAAVVNPALSCAGDTLPWLPCLTPAACACCCSQQHQQHQQ